MANNYLKFNNLGILSDSDLKQVSQGNHNVDYYYIAYDVYDYTNSYVTVATTLPDGTRLPELSTGFADFTFNDSDYKGFMFKLSRELTAISGNLSMTINLNSASDDTRLCSSRVTIPINASNVAVEPTITELQYNQLLETIMQNYNDLMARIEALENE